MDVWDEGTYFLIERDGTTWSIDRSADESRDCYTRRGPVCGLDPDDWSPPEAARELADLRGRFLAADRLEDLHAEASAGYYGSR